MFLVADARQPSKHFGQENDAESPEGDAEGDLEDVFHSIATTLETARTGPGPSSPR